MSNTDHQQIEKGVSFVNDRIKSSRDRISVLNSPGRLRDRDEIWEAYYDLEEAILMSKIIFNGFDKLGKRRRLPKIADLSDKEIRARFRVAEDNLNSAESNLSNLKGDETIESLRRARYQLKLMLVVIAARRGPSKRFRKRKP